MDQGIKRLIQTHPHDVLALAVPDAIYLGTLPVDVATEPQLTLDTLLRARIGEEECAVDIEAEAPLVAFTPEAREIATIERAAEFVKAHAPPGEVEELEALLAVFGARTFGAQAMQHLIRRLFMSTEILETPPLYQEWIRTATEKGMNAGIEQGRELGIEQGRELGVRIALREILLGRFGTLPAEVEQALEGADAATVHALLPHAGTDSLDALRARLGV